MTTRKSEQEPVPSGAHMGPACDRLNCDETRVWVGLNGTPLPGHCGCAGGRRAAEVDYALRHRQPVPSVELAAAS